MPPVVAHLHVHRLDPVTDLWCARCLLPSAVSVPMVLETCSGTIVGMVSATVCVDCGKRTDPLAG